MKFQTPTNPLNMDDNAVDFQEAVLQPTARLLSRRVLRKSFDGFNTDNFYRLDPAYRFDFIVGGLSW